VPIDVDPIIRGILVGFSFLSYFVKVNQGIANVFEGFVIPVVLRQGVESDPNQSLGEIFFVSIEVFYPIPKV